MPAPASSCIGARDGVKNQRVGLCITCAHLDGPGRAMQAPAYRGADGVWVCLFHHPYGVPYIIPEVTH